MEHILLIKSPAHDTDRLATRLRGLGFDVSVAADAASAYGIFIREDAQLVLVHHDPGVDDRVDLIRTFRSRARRSALPIATLLEDERESARCQRAGADLVLGGGARDPDRVIGAVSELLAQTGERGARRTVQREMGKALVRATTEVFETMLHMRVVPGPIQIEKVIPRCADVIGSIGIAGCLAGSLSLFMSGEFADRTAASMLMIDGPFLLGDALVADAIGEVTNMIGGCLKVELFDRNPMLEMSVPGVYIGRALRRCSTRDDSCLFVPFESEGESFSVEYMLTSSAGHIETSVEGQILRRPSQN